MCSDTIFFQAEQAMSHDDWVVNFIAVAVLALFFWLWLGPTFYRPLAEGGISRFHRFLKSLQDPQEEYQYFTLGHIIWSETFISEIEQLIRADSSALVPGVGPRPNIPRFLLHVNEATKRVYFVQTTDPSFDWDSVPHYEDYVKVVPDNL